MEIIERIPESVEQMTCVLILGGIYISIIIYLREAAIVDEVLAIFRVE